VSAADHHPTIRFRGRSFLAIVLAPEPPLPAWLAAFDAQIRRSPSFFVGRPVIVDLSALPAGRGALVALIEDLQGRDVRIIGIEGADPAWIGSETWGLPPMLTGSRPAGLIDIAAEDGPSAGNVAAPAPAVPPPALILDEPVRSGQQILADGDVTVLGAISSGAEVIAGGSIHVYGTLRGRAIAGASGNGAARIFCRRLEAELIAIDGLYKTADDIDAAARGRAIQARLDGDTLVVVPLA
jgi:septum site-determining protein MinC